MRILRNLRKHRRRQRCQSSKIMRRGGIEKRKKETERHPSHERELGEVCRCHSTYLVVTVTRGAKKSSVIGSGVALCRCSNFPTI